MKQIENIYLNNELVSSNAFNGWERVRDAIIIGKLQHYSKAPNAEHEVMWYQRWVGPVAENKINDLKQEFSDARLTTDSLVYDGVGYVYVPRSMLQ